MGKITYIHYLRGVAAFFIVAIHFNLFSSDNELIGSVFKYFLLEWTAIFIMISGFLFQHLIYKYQFKSFMFSKVKNVIIPYVIISVPAIMIYVFGFKKDHAWIDIQELLSNSLSYVILFFYATGSHLGPLWFIPVLILIFMTSKPLSIIGNNQNLLNLLAFLSLFLILFTSRPASDSNVFLAYLHFLPVYVIGMFIYSKKDFLIDEKWKFLSLSIFLAIFCLCVVFELSASVTIISKMPLFIFLCIALNDLNNKRAQIVLSVLADASFAIYFIHGYFVGFARKVFSQKINDIGNYEGMFLTLLLSSVTVLFVVALCFAMRRVTSHTRMIIGS